MIRRSPSLATIVAVVSALFTSGCGDGSRTATDLALAAAEMPGTEWEQYTVTWFATSENVTRRIPIILTDEEKDRFPGVLPPPVENQTERSRMFDLKSEITATLDHQFNVVFELLGTAVDRGAPRALSDLIRNGETPDIFTFRKRYEQYGPTSWRRYTATSWNPPEVSAEITPEEIATFMPEVYMDIARAAAASGLRLDQVWKRYSDEGKLYVVPVLYSPVDLEHLLEFPLHPTAILWRKDILDELGLSVPRTVRQWEEAFSRFKARYPEKHPWSRTGDRPIFEATGWSILGWYMRDGQLRPGYLQPEMRTAIYTLRQWYEYRYWDPDSRRGQGSFIVGDSMVIDGVDYRDGSWICEKPYWPGSIQDQCSIINPTAEFVISPRPAFSDDRKASTTVAEPFGLQGIAFGKHLEHDRAKLHRIMRILDSITHEEDMFLLANYGIEGEHWKWDEINGQRFPRRLPEAQTIKEQNDLNLGEHWMLAYSPLAEAYLLDPRIRESRDDLIRGSEAIYSPQQLTWEYSGVRALLSPDIAEKWRPMVSDFFFTYVYRPIFNRENPVDEVFFEFSAYWEEAYASLAEQVTAWYEEVYD